MNNDLVEQKHWDEGYEGLDLHIAGADEPIRLLLEKHLPRGPLRSIEIGCYPGRFLAVLGIMGHELHGIDMTPKVESELPAWLARQGYKIGSIGLADAFKFEPGRTYDVVCSFGLIEHFSNWEELFRIHASLVAPGGYLVISTPNFRSPLQRFLHVALDPDNLSQHNLSSMVPKRWRELALDCNLEVIQCGGVGRFEFWTGRGRRNLLQRIVRRAILETKPLWKLAPEGTLALAPYYAIVARRPSASDQVPQGLAK